MSASPHLEHHDKRRSQGQTKENNKQESRKGLEMLSEEEADRGYMRNLHVPKSFQLEGAGYTWFSEAFF